MIVAAGCCKAVRRTESGLQAHPPLFNSLRTVFGPLRRNRDMSDVYLGRIEILEAHLVLIVCNLSEVRVVLILF